MKTPASHLRPMVRIGRAFRRWLNKPRPNYRALAAVRPICADLPDSETPCMKEAI